MTRTRISRNRRQIRQSIGYNLGALYIGTASQDGSRLAFTDNTLRGGTDEYKGREVLMCGGTAGNIGESAVVTLYTPLNHTLTLAPGFTADITDGDEYEMWRLYSVEEINSAINQAIISASGSCLLDYETDSLSTSSGIYEYTLPSDFLAVYGVEYAVDGEAAELFNRLAPEHWQVVGGTEPCLRLTESGLGIIGDDVTLRISGYSAPTLLDDDDDVSEVDPAFLISAVTGTILMSHVKSPEIDTQYRAQLATYWLTNAERRLMNITTSLKPNTRWL
jgi:hypothetical protein